MNEHGSKITVSYCLYRGLSDSQTTIGQVFDRALLTTCVRTGVPDGANQRQNGGKGWGKKGCKELPWPKPMRCHKREHDAVKTKPRSFGMVGYGQHAA